MSSRNNYYILYPMHTFTHPEKYIWNKEYFSRSWKQRSCRDASLNFDVSLLRDVSQNGDKISTGNPRTLDRSIHALLAKMSRCARHKGLGPLLKRWWLKLTQFSVCIMYSARDKEEQQGGPIKASGDEISRFHRYFFKYMFYSLEDRAEKGPICYGLKTEPVLLREAETDQEVADPDFPLILFQSHFYIRTKKGRSGWSGVWCAGGYVIDG